MKSIAPIDIFALVWFFACWIGYASRARHWSKTSTSLLVVVNEYRLNWMRQMLKRENRMMDATLIGNLLRSISFFASTTIFILLALFTLFKYRAEASDILVALPLATPTPPILWDAKIFLLVMIFVYAFFKYTWSLRQYNYVCAIVGAAPPPSERNQHFEEYAQNSAKLIANAARHFNLGLRAYYFGLAALSWFISAPALILASAWVVWVLYRREFRSHALKYMTNPGIFRAQEQSSLF